MWWFPAMLCLAGLSSAVSFAWCWILTDSTLGAKGLFPFSPQFLIVRGVVYLPKNAAEWCFVWHSRFVWQYLVWPGTVIQASPTGNSFYPVDFYKHTVCVLLRLLSWLLSFLYAWNSKCIFWERIFDNFLSELSRFSVFIDYFESLLLPQ